MGGHDFILLNVSHLKAVRGLLSEAAFEEDPQPGEPLTTCQITVRILVERAEHAVHQTVVMHVECCLSEIRKEIHLAIHI